MAGNSASTQIHPCLYVRVGSKVNSPKTNPNTLPLLEVDPRRALVSRILSKRKGNVASVVLRFYTVNVSIALTPITYGGFSNANARSCKRGSGNMSGCFTRARVARRLARQLHDDRLGPIHSVWISNAGRRIFTLAVSRLNCRCGVYNAHFARAAQRSGSAVKITPQDSAHHSRKRRRET
jgi:hypothetical protein